MPLLVGDSFLAERNVYVFVCVVCSINCFDLEVLRI